MSKFKRMVAEKMGAKTMEVSVKDWDAMKDELKRYEENYIKACTGRREFRNLYSELKNKMFKSEEDAYKYLSYHTPFAITPYGSKSNKPLVFPWKSADAMEKVVAELAKNLYKRFKVQI